MPYKKRRIEFWPFETQTNQSNLFITDFSTQVLWAIYKTRCGEIWIVLKIMDNKVVQDLSIMPKSGQTRQDFNWPIKMNTSGSPQFIHLVSKQTKFHLILSEKLVRSTYQLSYAILSQMFMTELLNLNKPLHLESHSCHIVCNNAFLENSYQEW